MAAPHVIILNSGGLRSLVATALVRQERQKQRLTLLHVVDGRDNASVRLNYAERQGEQYRAGRVDELDLPHLFGHGHGKHPDGRPMGPLVTPQLLLGALAHARLYQAGRLVWPGAVDAEARAMAGATQQIELCDHLSEVEADPRPSLEAPLVEMSDQQIVQLGAQLEVDWRLAWSCLLAGDAPCHACPGCRRRRRAFDQAGMTDPIERRAPAR